MGPRFGRLAGFIAPTNALYSYSIPAITAATAEGQRTVDNLDPRTLKDRVVDEEILREEGRDDFSDHLLAPSEEGLTPDFYMTSAPVPTV
jgi:hypothetical protein